MSYLEITGVDLRKFVRAVYDMSEPMGMGFLHFKEGSLPDEDVDHILSLVHGDALVNMDYVRGRCCKMAVYKVGDRLFMRAKWYDHEGREDDLLKAVGMPRIEIKELPTKETA